MLAVCRPHDLGLKTQYGGHPRLTPPTQPLALSCQVPRRGIPFVFPRTYEVVQTRGSVRSPTPNPPPLCPCGSTFRIQGSSQGEQRLTLAASRDRGRCTGADGELGEDGRGGLFCRGKGLLRAAGRARVRVCASFARPWPREWLSSVAVSAPMCPFRATRGRHLRLHRRGVARPR